MSSSPWPHPGSTFATCLLVLAIALIICTAAARDALRRGRS